MSLHVKSAYELLSKSKDPVVYGVLTDGKYSSVSLSSKDLLGFDQHDLLGKPFSHRVHSSCVSVFSAILSNGLSNDIVLLRGDGSYGVSSLKLYSYEGSSDVLVIETPMFKGISGVSFNTLELPSVSKFFSNLEHLVLILSSCPL
jgi:hypothetical protein